MLNLIPNRCNKSYITLTKRTNLKKSITPFNQYRSFFINLNFNFSEENNLNKQYIDNFDKIKYLEKIREARSLLKEQNDKNSRE